MAFLSSFYPQPVVAGTTEGTFAEGDDARIVGALPAATAGTGSVLASGSTTARTLSNRFAERVNVLDYGADPTGSTNSRTAIEEAIADCAAGSILWFPSGTYLINTGSLATGIDVPTSKNKLTIAGDNATLLSSTKNNPQIFQIKANDVVIDGLTFDGFFRDGDSWYGTMAEFVTPLKNITASGDTITCNGHGLHPTTLIGFANLNGGNLVSGKIYQSINVIDNNTFKITDTYNGSTINVGNISSGQVGILKADKASTCLIGLFGQMTTIKNCSFINSANIAIVSRDGIFGAGSRIKSGGHKIENNIFKNCYTGVSIGSTNSYVVNAVSSTINTISLGSHDLQNGNEVMFGELVGGSSIKQDLVYYVVNRTSTTIQISETFGGSPINFGSPITSGGIDSVRGLSDYYICNNTIIDSSFLDFKSLGPRAINIFQFANCPPIRNFHINNNYIKNGGNLGIEIFGQHFYGAINDNYVECDEMGISCGGGDNVTVSGNNLRGGKFCQLEIAASSDVVVSGNIMDCKNNMGAIPVNSVACGINISNQGFANCNNLTISGNEIKNADIAIFTNASFTDNVVFDGNSIFATTANYNALTAVFQLQGASMLNWIISNNLINVSGTQTSRVLFADSSAVVKCSLTGNTLVGECKNNAIQFGGNGWLDISNNNLRDFTSHTDNPSTGVFLNANATNVSVRNNLSSDYSSLRRWIPDNQPIRLKSADNSSWLINVTNDGELEVTK